MAVTLIAAVMVYFNSKDNNQEVILLIDLGLSAETHDLGILALKYISISHSSKSTFLCQRNSLPRGGTVIPSLLSANNCYDNQTFSRSHGSFPSLKKRFGLHKIVPRGISISLGGNPCQGYHTARELPSNTITRRVLTIFHILGKYLQVFVISP